MFRHATLGDTIYFGFAVNTTAGTASDATSTPTFDVRKCGAAASAAPTLEGSATLLSHANFADGKYEISIAATSGNGFEADAEYLVFCDAAVSSVNPGGIVGGFRLAPIPANVTQLSGDSTAADNAEAFFDGTGYAGTNNVIPNVTTVTNLTNAATNGDLTATMKASVNTEVDTGIVDARLDHLLLNSASGTDVTDNSVIARLVSKSSTADWDSFDNTTASLEAIRFECAQNLGTLITRLGMFSGIGSDTAKGATDTLLSKIVGTLASGTHNPQSGDAYSRLGAPSGASIAADIAAVKTDTGNLVNRITSTLFSGITYLSRWLGAIAGKTADTTTRTEINATTAGAAYNETTDSQEAIRDRGDAAWTTGSGGGGGTGARTVSVTVQNSLSAPIENAKVRFSRTGESYVQTTNASGQCSFSLDDATWTVSITAIGYTYTPSTQVVDENETVTYTMTALSIPAASDPNTITGYIYCYDEDRDPVEDVQITCWVTDSESTAGFLDKNVRFTFLSDDTGQASHAFIKGRTYKGRGPNGEEISITVPSSGTSFALPSGLWR